MIFEAKIHHEKFKLMVRAEKVVRSINKYLEIPENLAVSKRLGKNEKQYGI